MVFEGADFGPILNLKRAAPGEWLVLLEARGWLEFAPPAPHELGASYFNVLDCVVS